MFDPPSAASTSPFCILMKCLYRELFAGAETASLLPPVGEEEEQSFSDNSLDSSATTAAPVLFTYAPSEGKLDQLTRRLGKLKNKKLYHRLLIRKFFANANSLSLPFFK